MRFTSIGECMVEMAPAGGDPALYRLGYAGDTFNTAWYARVLLPEAARVGYVSAVGQDDVSGRMLDFMATHGIETRHVARVPDRTVGLYAIAVTDGERSFSYWRSHSAARVLARHLPVPDAVGGEGAVLHLSGITLAIHAPEDRARLLDWVGAVRRSGATISFDPNIRPVLWEGKDAIAQWLPRAAALADHVLPSLDEETATFGAADASGVAERYLAWGAREVVVKNGPNAGLATNVDGTRTPFHPVKAPTIVDSTAAGDSFNAAYLVTRQRSAEPLESAQFACAVASTVVQHRGALVDGDLLGERTRMLRAR